MTNGGMLDLEQKLVTLSIFNWSMTDGIQLMNF
jgi:hypothetical protein